jgi:hypothetical protein
MENLSSTTRFDRVGREGLVTSLSGETAKRGQKFKSLRRNEGVNEGVEKVEKLTGTTAVYIIMYLCTCTMVYVCMYVCMYMYMYDESTSLRYHI